MTQIVPSFYFLLAHDPPAALENVKERLVRHRHQEHGGDMEGFYDCAVCGVLEKQLGRARRKVADSI